MMEDATMPTRPTSSRGCCCTGPWPRSSRARFLRHTEGTGAPSIRGPRGGVSVVPAANVDALVRDLVERGAVEGSQADWEALRVSRFLPRFGVDFGEKNYPQEASLEQIAVSFNKGCYLGRKWVGRLEMRGDVIKKIVPVRLEGGEPPGSGAEVRSAEGKAVGTVSSAAAGEGGPLALAMVRIDFAEPGTKLDVAGRPAVVLGPR